MFGNMLGGLGNLEEKQAEMQAKMRNIAVKTVLDGITIEGNASREVTNVKVAPELLQDAEELEDKLVIAMNRFMREVSAVEGQEAQRMMQEMLPMGMGGLLGNMFK